MTTTIAQALAVFENPTEATYVATQLNRVDADIAAVIAGEATNIIASSIVNGDLTHAPDGNSVFDALALKEDAASLAADAQAACISQVITNGVTTKSPSEDAVFDALALKNDAAFTPGVSGDWSPAPTTIQAALDQLAARVKALEP